MRRYEVKLSAYRTLNANLVVEAETNEQAVEIAIDTAKQEKRELFWHIDYETPLKDMKGTAFAGPLLEEPNMDLLARAMNAITHMSAPEALMSYLPAEKMEVDSTGAGVTIMFRKTASRALRVRISWDKDTPNKMVWQID